MVPINTEKMMSTELFDSTSHGGCTVLYLTSADTSVKPATSFDSAANNIASAIHGWEGKQILSRSKRQGFFIREVIKWFGKTVLEGIIGWVVGKVGDDLTGSDETKEYTEEILHAIDENYQAINRNYEAIQNVQRGVAENIIWSAGIYAVVNETKLLIENMMLRMQENFNRVLESLRDARVAPLATSINNFIDYFLSEREMVSGLSESEYLAKMRQQDDLLKYLKESSSPKGDSLRSSLYAILRQNLAIPRYSNDSTAFSALQALFYGAQTHASVMLYLLEQYIRLAELCYRRGDLAGFNDNMDSLWTHFKSFEHSLVADRESLLGNVIEVIRFARDRDFIPKRGENSYRVLSEQVRSLSRLKAQLQSLSLPIIPAVPERISGSPTFPEAGVSTPLGDWRDGATVRYALQYRSNNSYSKIGEWSAPMIVCRKANPTLEIRVDPQRRERLIFRQFNNESPQLVGVLDPKHYETEFRDIDRDLYNAALNFDGDTAVREASILIDNGADVNAAFENGWGVLHAAAQSDNLRLARSFLARTDFVGLDAMDARGFTPLHVAAEAGHSGFVELLVERGADVNARTFEKLTPLHIAAYTGFNPTVAALLKSEAIDVNARNANGFTPLHSAVFGGSKVLQTLMSHNGTDLNAQSDAGMTALHLAAVNNFLDIAALLAMDDSLDVAAGAQGNLTALHFATMGGDVQMVKLLTGLGKVDVNAQSVLGWTPLHFAVSLKNEEVAFELLNCNRTKPDSAGKSRFTPLHLAALTGQTNFVKRLQEMGVDTEKKTDDGKTVLHFAAMQGSVETISAALALITDVNNKTLDGLTPLHLAASSPFSSIDIVKYLVYKGANMSDQSNSGETCLHFAARGGVVGVIKYFVKNNFPINAEDNLDRHPLHLAVGNGRLEAVQYLEEKGALGGETKNRETLLHFAAYSGHLGVVKIVASNSTDVDSKDTRGYTPVFIAYRNNHTDVLEYLIEAENADLNVQFDRGETLLHIASSDGDLYLVDLCVRNGADCCAKDDNKLSPLVSAAKKGHLYVVKYLTAETNLDLESTCNFIARPVAANQGHLEVVKHLGRRHTSAGFLFLEHFLSLLAAIENGHLDIIDHLLQEEIHFPSTESEFAMPYVEHFLDQVPFREVASDSFPDVAPLARASFLMLLALKQVETFKKVAYCFLALAAEKKHHDVAKLILDKKVADFNIGMPIFLHVVASYGYLNLVLYLTERRKVKFDTEDQNGMTPFLRAAQQDHYNVVEYLADKGAKLVSSGNITPLFFAAANGNIRMCEYLLQRGADVNITRSRFKMNSYSNIGATYSAAINDTTFEGTVLSNAARNGHWQLVKYLTMAGANINADYDRNYTPIHIAAETGQLDDLKYLVEEFQARVDGTDLFIAASHGHLDLVKYLVEKGVDIKTQYERNFTPLHVAAKKGHLSVVKYFVEECQADVDAPYEYSDIRKSDVVFPDYEGNRTSFYCAVEGGRLDVLEYVYAKCRDPSVYSKAFEQNPILTSPSHLAVLKFLIARGFSFSDSLLPEAADRGNLEAIKRLVEHGADVHYRTHAIFLRDQTALHFAANSGHLDVVKYLVEEKNEKVDVEDNYKRTPLHYAAGHGHLNVIEYLVQERRAAPNVENISKETPLLVALSGGYRNVADFFLSLADVSCPPNQLDKCLDGAVECGMLDFARELLQKGANATLYFEVAISKYKLDLAKALIEKGADANTKLSFNRTPLHFAAEKGDLALVQVLVDKGAIINAEDDSKMSPYRVAKMFCNTAVAEFLEFGHIKRISWNIEHNRYQWKQVVFDPAKNRLSRKRRNLMDGTALFSKTPGRWFVGGGYADIGLENLSSFHATDLAQLPVSAPEEDHSNDKSRKVLLNGSSTISDAISGYSASGSSRPSSWINTLSHAVLDAFMGLSRFMPSPFKPSIAAEQPAASMEALSTLDTDPQGSLFLLDMLIRRWTGQKHIATADLSMSPREIQTLAANVTGRFVSVLGDAATSNGVSPHRLDIDVAEAMSVVRRKMTGGNFKDIAGELRSLVSKACPGLEAGYPGRLSSRKFEMFLHEVDERLEAILNQAMVEMVQITNGRPSIGKFKRRQVAVQRGGYVGHSSVRLPVDQAGIDRRRNRFDQAQII